MQLPGRLGQRSKAAADPGQIDRALRGQRHAPRQPREQRKAQMPLQYADLLGDGALRDAQLIGGGAKVQPATRDLEGTQSVQRRQPAAGNGHDTP